MDGLCLGGMEGPCMGAKGGARQEREEEGDDLMLDHWSRKRHGMVGSEGGEDPKKTKRRNSIIW